MGTIVTVKNGNAPGGKSILVTSQKLVDGGREKHPNGRDEVEPGEERDFIVHDTEEISIGQFTRPSAEEVADLEETSGETQPAQVTA